MSNTSGDPKEPGSRKPDMTPQTAPSAISTAPPPVVARTPLQQTPESLRQLLQTVAELQDKTAFAQLFAFFAPRLKSFYLRGGAGGAAAEEMVQETMLLVWRKASLFDPAIAGASTWIFAIARNQRIDRIRRERRFTQLDDHMLDKEEAEDPKGDETVYASQSEARLHDAIQDLPPQQVEVLQMSFFENKSHSEIAEVLTLPIGTVKSRLRLAFGKLRTSLEDIWE